MVQEEDPKFISYQIFVVRSIFEYVYKNKVIVGLMRLKTHAINLQTTIKLKGLVSDGKYEDKTSGQIYYGSQLMQFGLPIKASCNTNDYYATVWEFALS